MSRTFDAEPTQRAPGLAPDELPPLNRGDRNLNPPGIRLLTLLREDLRTYDGNPFDPGFWAVFQHRFGNWRMGFRWKLVRAPLTLLYRVTAYWAELIGGIHLPYTVRLGRRVRIWHHGGIVLHARSIGDDVVIRHNTTFGLASSKQKRAIPTIGDRVDIGCGACILGNVTVGHDAVIGANAVVVRDVPAYATAVGIPARVIKTVRPPESDLSDGSGPYDAAVPGVEPPRGVAGIDDQRGGGEDSAPVEGRMVGHDDQRILRGQE